MKKIVTISIAIMLILLLMLPVVGCQEKPPPQPTPTPVPAPAPSTAPAPAPAPSLTAEPPPAPIPPPTLPKPVPAPPAKLESVSIMPIEVVAGETQQLEAIATDEKGNQLSEFDTSWKMTDEKAGYITQGGLFTAGKVAGDFTDAVKVQAIQGELTRTSLASITVTPSPLEQVVIAPNLAEIGIEMTQQFVAVGADRYGNHISDLTFSWSVENDGGTIDETGLFTVGATLGTYEDTVKVEATQGNVTRSVTADVTVEPDRILFISGNITEETTAFGMEEIVKFKRADIYVMDADGRNINQLTDTSATEGKFSCSPDGQRIVYESGGSRSKIMVMSTDGSGKLCLSGDDTETSCHEPNWSPDSTRLVFSSYNDKEENSDIYVVDMDGGNLTQLTDTTDFSEYSPVWFPDGSKIVFASSEDEPYMSPLTFEIVYAGRSDTYVMDADGGNLTQLTDTKKGGVLDWSPDGARIMFWVRGEIWVMNADGSDQKRLALGTAPMWAPDGSQIVFASSDGMYVINADGSNKRQLTKNKELMKGAAPAWSPDGSKIIFVSNEYEYSAMPAPGLTKKKQHKRSEICVMDADGKNQISLTDNSKCLIMNLRWVPRKRGVEVNEESVIILAPAP